MELNLKPIVIVEGFEMVGKSYFIDKVLVKGNGYANYHPNHDLTDITIGRNKSWTLGYGVMDLLEQISSKFSVKIAIDRHVCSSYVYSKMNNDSLDLNVVDYYKNNKFFHNEVTHIYICPKNKAASKWLWELSKSREKNKNPLSAQYDKFDSFEEYYNTYRKYNKLFHESYRIMNLSPIVIYVDKNGNYSYSD